MDDTISRLNSRSRKPAYSRTFAETLQIVAAIGNSGLVVLPAEPTPDMLAAGAAAGGIAPGAVRRILAAVFAAAE